MTNHAEGIPNAVSPCCAGCAGSVIGALEAMVYADCTSCHVDQDLGNKERVQTP